MRPEFINKLTRVAGKTALKIKAKSPEILIGFGIACGVACVFTACCETHSHADDILDSHKEAKKKIDECKEKYPDEYTKVEVIQDTALMYVADAKNVVKYYWPSMVLGAASCASILCAHGIMSSRYSALLADFTALDGAFKRYRNNIKKTFGDGADQIGLLNGKMEEDKNEDGSYNLSCEDSEDDLPPWTFTFGHDTSTEWKPDPEYCEALFKLKESRFNELLRVRGYVLLNEVLYELGLTPTSRGCRLGWVWGMPGQDDIIDFGAKRINIMTVEGHSNLAYILDFNTMGEIDGLIDRINLGHRVLDY